ncbi:MAG: methionine aminotransferase [Marinilabiliales bacterium]|nr:MAG: methionine aminotransferase [Marinilabiliales bacterium]
MEISSLNSKLPNTGTSIFAVMSGLAIEHNAINLSQGFPDFPISEELIDIVNYYMKEGYNQYAPMPGVISLRKAISEMFEQNHNSYYNPDTEITIAAGATQALFTAISAFINKGDEAIILEPAYDSYAPAVELNGGRVKRSKLLFPEYKINREEIAALVTGKTRLLIINSPHNPTGSLLQKEDMEFIQKLCKGTDIIVISDEVYEHLIFEKHQHESACRFSELKKRSIVIGSFGKTFHATGWKTGFALAPEYLMKEFRKVHQFTVFASNTPIQYAISDYIKKPENYNYLGDFFQKKRDIFVNALAGSKFKPLTCLGTYFQLLDYSRISDEKELDFAKRLTIEHGIASVPVSPFYKYGEENQSLRFCFAKEESTLLKAAEILCKI